MGPEHAFVAVETITLSVTLIAFNVVVAAILFAVATRNPTAADWCREYEFEL